MQNLASNGDKGPYEQSVTSDPSVGGGGGGGGADHEPVTLFIL